ncbi:hypothetical protein SNEBB_008294 [Seison nebaliae]|nr:hypothetical protein SNEBB_008294 [Seison nebaliae]
MVFHPDKPDQPMEKSKLAKKKIVRNSDSEYTEDSYYYYSTEQKDKLQEFMEMYEKAVRFYTKDLCHSTKLFEGMFNNGMPHQQYIVPPPPPNIRNIPRDYTAAVADNMSADTDEESGDHDRNLKLSVDIEDTSVLPLTNEKISTMIDHSDLKKVDELKKANMKQLLEKATKRACFTMKELEVAKQALEKLLEATDNQHITDLNQSMSFIEKKVFLQSNRINYLWSHRYILKVLYILYRAMTWSIGDMIRVRCLTEYNPKGKPFMSMIVGQFFHCLKCVRLFGISYGFGYKQIRHQSNIMYKIKNVYGFVPVDMLQAFDEIETK